MGRPRTLDPANLPPSPNLTEDHERERELLAEFHKRLECLEDNYRFCKETSKDRQGFNESIETIARSLRRKRLSSLELKRLHPTIEAEITRRAKQLSETRSREVTKADVDEAAAEFIAKVPKLKGRPRNVILYHHVAGVIALLQQLTGRPVIAHRDKDSKRDPHFIAGISKALPLIFGRIDPEATFISLVECTIAIRREYAGKTLDFLELFPTYGAKIGENGELAFSHGITLESLDYNIPLYSR